MNYYEDIYNGYRYFETIPGAAEQVIYPFGFGLSYTDFSVRCLSAKRTGDTITVSCEVKNTGKCPGREVIQVYGEAPQGKLGKANRVLCAFRKTGLLAPGESEISELTFDMNCLESYDDLGIIAPSAFLLERGAYKIYLGTDVRHTQCVLTTEEPVDRVLS